MTTPQPAALPERIWTCQIGGHGELPQGADGPMRDAIASAFKAVTGSDASYCFSGWGQPLPERYRAVVENRLPDPDAIRHECFAVLDTLPDAVTAPGGDFAALQSQPAAAGVSDAEIDRICYLATEIRFAKTDDAAQAVIDQIRAILALRPQASATAAEQEGPRAYLICGGRLYKDQAVMGLSVAEDRVATRGDGSRIEPLYTLALRPQEVPMTEDEFVACLVKANCVGVVKMSYDSGPYYVTRPSINASKLKEAFEAHHGITAPAGGEG